MMTLGNLILFLIVLSTNSLAYLNVIRSGAITTRRVTQPHTHHSFRTPTFLCVSHERTINDGMENVDAINISKLVEDVVSEASSLSTESHDSVVIDEQLSIDQSMMQEAIKVAASRYACMKIYRFYQIFTVYLLHFTLPNGMSFICTQW